MSTYTFRNNETGEEFDKVLSFAGRAKFLEENQNCEVIITSSPVLGDSVRMGITQPPADFQRGVIGRIKANVPNNNITSRFKIPREL